MRSAPPHWRASSGSSHCRPRRATFSDRGRRWRAPGFVDAGVKKSRAQPRCARIACKNAPCDLRLKKHHVVFLQRLSDYCGVHCNNRATTKPAEQLILPIASRSLLRLLSQGDRRSFFSCKYLHIISSGQTQTERTQAATHNCAVCRFQMSNAL